MTGLTLEGMDHLQKVRDPIRHSVDVPFLCGEFGFNPNPLTFEDFEAIPQKYGYNMHDSVGHGCAHQASKPDIAFLQSWLFFGLLVQLIGPIGVTLSRDEFVRVRNDGKPVISTEALPKYLWFWLAVRHNQPRRETEDHAKLADSCLELANRVANKLASHESSPIAPTSKATVGERLFYSNGRGESAAERVLLSLVILGETLCHARDQIVRYNVGPALHWNYPPLGTALLQNAGWCIAEINSL